MSLAGEIIDFARDYFEMPDVALTPDTDLVATFSPPDPDAFGYFIESVSKRYGIRTPELKDVFPDPANPPKGKLRFLYDAFFSGQDVEVVYIQQLTATELAEIIREGIWPQRFVMPLSQVKAIERQHRETRA